jgi:hypothetical protein
MRPNWACLRDEKLCVYFTDFMIAALSQANAHLRALCSVFKRKGRKVWRKGRKDSKPIIHYSLFIIYSHISIHSVYSLPDCSLVSPICLSIAGLRYAP